MGSLKVARRSLLVAALVMLLGVAGCAGGLGGPTDPGDAGARVGDGEALSDRDSNAVAQLVEIAARDAEPEGPVLATECWAPSQNPILGEADTGGERGLGKAGDGADESGYADGVGAADQVEFRVLCRVHFKQQGAERYRDMICLGSLGRDPVAEYCYQWAYYADAPKFEDRPAFAAPASR